MGLCSRYINDCIGCKDIASIVENLDTAAESRVLRVQQ